MLFFFVVDQTDPDALSNAGTEGVKDASEEINSKGDEDEENIDKTNEGIECPLALKLKILSNITTRILPQLHKCLTKKVGRFYPFITVVIDECSCCWVGGYLQFDHTIESRLRLVFKGYRRKILYVFRFLI